MISSWRRSNGSRLLLSTVIASSVLLSLLTLVSNVHFHYNSIYLDVLRQLLTPHRKDVLSRVWSDWKSDIAIDRMIKKKQTQWYEQSALVYSNKTFEELEAEYVQLFGMQPPTGFDAWYQFALERNALTSHEAYMPIYNDLEPFYSVDPKKLRFYIESLKYNGNTAVVSIRNSEITTTRLNWRSQGFIDMLHPIVKFLPDMDIAVNLHDEPRIVLAPAQLQAAREQAKERKKSIKNDPPILYSESDGHVMGDLPWIHTQQQSQLPHIKYACANDSAVNMEDEYHIPKSILLDKSEVDDLCGKPYLHDIHGPLFTPSSSSVMHELVPIFSECKLGINSDILFPAAMYYIADDRDARYATVHDRPWAEKSETIFWAGVNSGGSQQSDRLSKQLRYRLIDLMDPDKHRPENKFIDKVRQTSQVGLTSLINCEGSECDYIHAHYKFLRQVKMETYLEHKLLIDVDGQSFSGRFRPFMASHALTLKQTLYREWWEPRFKPWVHYIPLSTSLSELFELIHFFIGHQSTAQHIAEESRVKVFSKGDMEVYLLRLLLEYSRLFRLQ